MSLPRPSLPPKLWVWKQKHGFLFHIPSLGINLPASWSGNGTYFYIASLPYCGVNQVYLCDEIVMTLVFFIISYLTYKVWYSHVEMS